MHLVSVGDVFVCCISVYEGCICGVCFVMCTLYMYIVCILCVICELFMSGICMVYVCCVWVVYVWYDCGVCMCVVHVLCVRATTVLSIYL